MTEDIPRRLVRIDLDGGLLCPWHGAQTDSGSVLGCGCTLETGAHGFLYAVRAANDVAKKFDLVAKQFAATCEPTPEIAP